MHYHLLARTNGPKGQWFSQIISEENSSFIYEIYDLLASRAARIPDGFLSRHIRSSFPKQGVTMPQFDTLYRRCVTLLTDDHSCVSKVASLIHTPMVTKPFHPTSLTYLTS
jgi:hypothetical protein